MNQIQCSAPLERVVRTITVRLISSLPTTAEIYRLGFLRLHDHRREIGRFVRTVAEWLLPTPPTSTPSVSAARFDLGRVRSLLCDDGFGHLLTPSIVFSCLNCAKNNSMPNFERPPIASDSDCNRALVP